jgi:hypothetical protein
MLDQPSHPGELAWIQLDRADLKIEPGKQPCRLATDDIRYVTQGIIEKGRPPFKIGIDRPN